jgi:hypothetical protein
VWFMVWGRGDSLHDGWCVARVTKLRYAALTSGQPMVIPCRPGLVPHKLDKRSRSGLPLPRVSHQSAGVGPGAHRSQETRRAASIRARASGTISR